VTCYELGSYADAEKYCLKFMVLYPKSPWAKHWLQKIKQQSTLIEKRQSGQKNAKAAKVEKVCLDEEFDQTEAVAAIFCGRMIKLSSEDKVISYEWQPDRSSDCRMDFLYQYLNESGVTKVQIRAPIYFTQGNIEKAFILYGAGEGSCHAASAHHYGLIFNKKQGDWCLEEMLPQLECPMGYGKLCTECRIVDIGNGKIGIITKGQHCGQGHCTITTNLFAKTDSQWSNIAKFTGSHSHHYTRRHEILGENLGNTAIDMDMDFLCPEDGGYCDIRVVASGKTDETFRLHGKEYTANAGFSNTRIYRLMDGEYKELYECVLEPTLQLDGQN
jgi:hypothetical protein